MNARRVLLAVCGAVGLALAVGLVVGTKRVGIDDGQPPASQSEPLAGSAPSPVNARKIVQAAIKKEQQRLRELPGRTGILAEETRYSLFFEELIIRDFFQDRKAGFFLDVGCAGPILANNTYYLEKHLGWTGIGIDALAEYAADWAKERPASKFFNFLVTDHSGTDDRFFKSESLGLSSTSRFRADGRRFGGALEVEEIRVPSITLNDLLDELAVTHVDLLAMDIEGHEMVALRGFDLERFRPELIVSEGERGDVEKFLAEHGYERIERYVRFDRTNRYYHRRADQRPAEPLQ